MRDGDGEKLNGWGNEWNGTWMGWNLDMELRTRKTYCMKRRAFLGAGDRMFIMKHEKNGML